MGGVLDADSLALAKERLRKQQVLVTDLSPVAGHSGELKLPPSLLLSFTRELAELLRAGLPLYESLVTIEEKYERHSAHSLFLDLADHLKTGGSFSGALRRYPGTFDPIYQSMVQAGEQSGGLVGSLGQLAELIQRRQKLQKQLISAVTYPALLALFAFCILLALLLFIVPTMRELFEDRQVHPITVCVLALSSFLCAHLGSLSMGIGVCIVAAYMALKKPGTRLRLYLTCLKLPLMKALLLDAAFVRFFRASGMLLAGGVPLLHALSLSRAILKSPPLEASISAAEKRIAQGEPLSLALKNAPLIPPIVLRMLALAEETGKMGEAFYSLASIYDERVDKHLAQLGTFLQPALLIIIGAVVGLVVLSVLLPLTDVGSFVN